jgi:APA family basic amino acid/polyamine antiporter
LPTAVSVGAVTAMLGVLLSQVLALSRMVFAMARGGDLPGLFAHVHGKRGVPDRAVLVVGLVSAAVAATGSLGGVASTASFAILVYYGIANLCALRMPRSLRRYPDAVAFLGLLACMLLLFSLAGETLIGGSILVLAGIIYRLLRGAIARRD